MNVFKAYDVRGKYPEEVNEKLAFNIGKAMVVLLGAKNFLIAMDARKGSEKLAEALTKGITGQGSNVTMMGLATTPMFYYFKKKKGFDAGVMITASHLPAGFNGLKAMRQDGFMGYDTGFKEIEEMINSGRLDNIFSVDHKGSVEEESYDEEYIDFVIRNSLGNLRGLKVVVDGSNGMAGPIAEKILLKADVDFIGLNMSYKLENPAHSLNPLEVDAHVEVIEKIKETGAAFGAIFDADGDRIVFIDDKGESLSGDYTVAILAKHLAKPGDIIVHDLLCGRAFIDSVKKLGCEPVVSRVGHLFIKHKMVELNARLGAEASCHMYFQEAGGAESSVLCLLNMIGIINEEERNLSEILAPLRAAYVKSPELNYRFESNEVKDAKIEQIKVTFTDGMQSFLDGVKVDYDDAWFNVRKSNTEPVLRVRIEGKTASRVNELQVRIEAIVKN